MHAKHVPFLRLSKFLTLTQHHQSFLDFTGNVSVHPSPIASCHFLNPQADHPLARLWPWQLVPKRLQSNLVPGIWFDLSAQCICWVWDGHHPLRSLSFMYFFTKPGWFNRNIIVVTLSSGLSTHDGPRYSIPPSVHLLFSDGKERVHTHLARIFGTLSGQSNPRTYGLRFEISYQPTIGFGTMYPLYPFVRLT